MTTEQIQCRIYRIGKEIEYIEESKDPMYMDPRFGWQQRQSDIADLRTEEKRLLRSLTNR